MANKNALDLATLVYNTGVVMPGKALATKPPTGTGDLSFSRAGTAVRIDANGAEETMPANVLRVDYRFNLDGANTCPVSLVEAGKSEVLSLSDLIAGGFTFDNCTVCYTVNLQKVVKVYKEDGTSKTFIDGEAFSTGTDTKPDALSFPIGDYSALQDIVIIKAVVDDAKAIELSTNPLLVGRSKLGLAVYVNLLLNGYTVNGVSCLMAAGTTVESLIALGFNTALFAGEQKATKLSFYQAIESGGKLVLPPTLLEADFSRPNIGATSGATVFRDGVLVELAENEPDFSDESGCPVLKMRPQAENIAFKNLDFSSGYTLLGITNNGVGGASPLNGVNYREFRETIENRNHALAFITPGQVIGVKTNCELIFKPVGGRRYFRIFNNGGGGGAIVVDTLTETITSNTLTNDTKLIALNGGSFYAAINFTPNASGNFNVQMASIDDDGATSTFIGDTAKGFEVIGFTVTKSNTIEGIIPNDTLNLLTRSSNSFQLTNLVSRGLLGATQGTIYINTVAESLARGAIASILTIGNTVGSRVIISNAGPDVTRPYLIVETPQGNSVFQLTADSSKSIISYKEGQLIMVVNGVAVKNNALSLDLSASSDLNCFGASRPVDINGIAFAPIALTEAQAIAALNEL
tara:strand:+ start:13231 stop:15135 length:1905 start_codon:yes stop_codon:yes gene_type:complete